MSTHADRGRNARGDRWMRRAAPLMLMLMLPLLAWSWNGPAEPTVETPSDDAVAVDPLGTPLPLHVNARVERWMQRFQTTQRDEFEMLLRRRGIYADLVRSKLRERGMPEELLYLAMMESGFLPGAVSPVSAVGLWQFMTPTAQQFGLRVDAYVDERRDPVRATDAALDYLQWLHDRFGGSWYLAAAAYNAGPGRVERVLRRHASGRRGEEQIYWEILDHLPRETREYVPRLIAATLLAEHADAYGFTVQHDAPYRYETVFVPGGTTLRRIAQVLDVPVRDLRALNPHLIRGMTPPGEVYGVRVPVGGTRKVVLAMAPSGGVRRAD